MAPVTDDPIDNPLCTPTVRRGHARKGCLKRLFVFPQLWGRLHRDCCAYRDVRRERECCEGTVSFGALRQNGKQGRMAFLPYISRTAIRLVTAIRGEYATREWRIGVLAHVLAH